MVNEITKNGTAENPDIPKGGVFGFLGASLDIRLANINENIGNGVTLHSRSNARIYWDTKVNSNNGNGIQLMLGAAFY